MTTIVSAAFLISMVLLVIPQVHTQVLATTIAPGNMTNDSSIGRGSTDGAANDTIQFYTTLSEMTVKPYLVGLRKTETGDNICYGVLISTTEVLTSGCNENWGFFDFPHLNLKRKFAVIGSLYNAGSHDDGSETIKIKTYKKGKYYSNSGYRAVGVYELEKASTKTAVDLPASISLQISSDASLKTYGWVAQGSDHVMSERVVKYADASTCDDYKISFKNCICTVPLSGEDGCNIVNGSPLILTTGGKEVLVGMRYTYEEACDKLGFPVAFTRITDVMQ